MTIRNTLFLLTASLLSIAAAGAQDLPDGDAKEIVVRACTACHGTDRIIAQKKTKDQWQQTVSRMVNRGAQLDPDEVEVVVAYLSRNFPKEAGFERLAERAGLPARELLRKR